METSLRRNVLVEFRGKSGRYSEQTARCSADLSAKLATPMCHPLRNTRPLLALILLYPPTGAATHRQS